MKGILLVNLGSPDSPSVKDVKRYLSEFLMDERVIDISYLWRFLLVRGLIVNTRSKRSAKAYKKVWTSEGSPLVVISKQLTEEVKSGLNCPVALSMRYGSGSIKDGLTELHEQGVDEVLMIPLYPQFAMSSTETVNEKAREILEKHFPDMTMDSMPAFYNNEDYLSALTVQIKEELKGDTSGHFLFSYHGLPERHIYKSDVTKLHCKIDGSCCKTPSAAHEFCYRHQSYKMTEELVKRLGIKEGNYTTSFQSRLGNDPWIQPFTDEVLVAFPKNNVRKLKVITPSFVSDCLETLEEMDMENRQMFKDAGGEEFQFIPCLNTHPDWVATVQKWCVDWMEKGEELNYLKIK